MFVSNDFRGKSHFEDDGTRNYLVFLSVVLCFKNMANSDNMSAWKSKGLSDEYSCTFVKLYLNQNTSKPSFKLFKIFTYKKVVHTYFVYEINLWSFTVVKDFALQNSLFGAVTLTNL